MGRVDFYRVSRDPVQKVLPALASRLLGQGDRLLIVAASAMQRQEIDSALWSHQPTSFLPHGAAGSADEAKEPILISGAFLADPPNGARHVALADGVWQGGALAFERVFLLFDDSRISEARDTWRQLKDVEGVERHFWKQDEQGRWAEAG